MKYSWRSFDPVIVVSAILLAILGVTMIYSAVAGKAAGALHWRQLAMLGLGSGLFIVCTFVDVRLWFRGAPWLYGIMAAILAIVLVAGTTANGAQRWVSLGPLGVFQPSEPAKLLLVLSLARFLAGSRDGQYGTLGISARKFIFALGIIALPMLMVMLQPDLGTAVVIGVVGFGLIFVAGGNWIWLSGVVMAGIAALPEVLHDYQKQRLMVFANPEIDPMGAGWNIIQSKIAVGSGGLWGKGLLLGTQNRLDFVPEHHTDFIFTVIGEELGLVGCVVVILLFAALVARGLQISKGLPSTFESLVAAGIAITLGAHAIINLGMAMGLLPVVGIPLPLVSYGGSAVLTNLAALGILNQLSSRTASAQGDI